MQKQTLPRQTTEWILHQYPYFIYLQLTQGLDKVHRREPAPSLFDDEQVACVRLINAAQLYEPQMGHGHQHWDHATNGGQTTNHKSLIALWVYDTSFLCLKWTGGGGGGGGGGAHCTGKAEI